MRTRVIGLTLAATLGLASLAACGDDGGDAKAAGSTTSTTIAADAGTSATTSSTTGAGHGTATTVDEGPYPFAPVNGSAGEQGDVLRNGRYFGVISTMASTPTGATAQFDLEEVYSGEEGDRLRREDGLGEDVGSEGIYVRNLNPRLRTLTIAADAIVFDIHYGEDSCCEPLPSTVAAFISGRDARPDEPSNTTTNVNVTVQDGVVIKLQEVYFE